MNNITGLILISEFLERQRGAEVTMLVRTVGSCLRFGLVSNSGIFSRILVTFCYWCVDDNENIILNAYEPSENEYEYSVALDRIVGSKLQDIEIDTDEIVLVFSNGVEFSMMNDEEYDKPGEDEWVVFFEEGYPALIYSVNRGFFQEKI